MKDLPISSEELLDTQDSLQLLMISLDSWEFSYVKENYQMNHLESYPKH